MFVDSGKIIFTAILILSGFAIYTNVFKEDLSTRFHYLSVENKLKYEKCLKEYKDNYCDKHEIPYLEDYCLQLKVCIQSFESYAFLKKEVIASRLQILIKYLFLDNVDLLLKNYIYSDENSTSWKQNGVLNLIVVVIIAVLFVILPLYIITHNIRRLLMPKTTSNIQKCASTDRSHDISHSEQDNVIIEEKI